MRLALAALAFLFIAAAAALVPQEPYQDIQVLFHANMGLLQGIGLYDQPGQVEMIAQIAGVPTAQVYVLPFPYPPWLALSTIWLARLPVEIAARTWFGLNLLMLVVSIALLTRGQPLVRRALVFLGAILWLPTLGSLFVGQYGFPVLLGAALMIQALGQERPMLLAVAAALLTFKPHLGLAILVLVVAVILSRRYRFSRDALLALLAGGALLFGLGFVASPRWPVEYAVSLLGFRGVHGVPECTQCVSLAMMLARLFAGDLGTATWIALALAVLSCWWVLQNWKPLAATTSGVVLAGALATLLASPYLLSYDYLLLLVPLITLAGRIRLTGEWIALGVAYALPAVAVAEWGSAGNLVLIVSTGMVLVLLSRSLRFATQAVKFAA